jgi:NAD-dependent dihydropyrimidine dehydrogenase PreA subunit
MDAEKQSAQKLNPDKRDRGLLEVDGNECKGCGLCVEACPLHLIGLSERLNHYGYRTAEYAGKGCTACGICYVVCPEPGAITVRHLEKPATRRTEGAAVCAGN